MAFAIAACLAESLRSPLTVSMIASRSVPTSTAVPASTPSARSVSLRRTTTGTPKAGASSWIPPESVMTRVQAARRLASSK